MINIICKECGFKLPFQSNKKGDKTIMNSTYTKDKEHYPNVVCPNCLRTLVEGKAK